LDHVIVMNERYLRKILVSYFRYYHRWRVHQPLEMDCLERRPAHPRNQGRIIEIAELGGLHHHYERVAA